MRYPNCKNCMYNNGLRCVDCNWGSEFEEKRTAKERMAEFKLALANAGSTGKKLVGSIMDGYSYVDTDVANTMQMAANQIIKQELNNIYGKKKEERDMKAIDIYNLTKNNGMATITAGGTSIPVRITDVEHKSDMYAGDETTLTVTVCHVPAPLARRAAKQRRSDLIKNVYFNDPVTVVIWTDGSKTIVKANGEEPYDPEKGLAMAIAKKFMGDNETKSNYYDVFKKWLPKPKPRKDGVIRKSGPCPWGERDSFNPASRLGPVDEDRWHIWVTHLDTKTGEIIGNAVYPRDYASKSGATRAAIRMYGPDPRFTKWIVSKTNPWEKEEK